MAEAGLTLLRELRRRGWAVKVDGDHLMVKPPKPDAVEEARPLLEELRRRKAEVLAALRGCPTCGATAEELETARKKRALDQALADCERHLATCRTCRGWGGPYCAEMETLREAHFRAWQAYYGQPEGEWDPWRS